MRFGTRFELFLSLGAIAATGCDSAPTVAPIPRVATAPRELGDPKLAPPGRPLSKSFDDLKFAIEPDGPFDRSMLTPEIEQIAQRRIEIRGYILPTAQKRLKSFVLVRDNMECCFGPGAALYDCILVEMDEGKLADFSVRPVKVTGTFRIEEFMGPDDRPLAVFQMRGEEVK